MITTLNEPRGSSHYRPPQYSLATLLILVAFCGLVLAVMRWTGLIDFGLFVLILGAIIFRTAGRAWRGMLLGLMVGGLVALSLNLELDTLTIRQSAITETAGITLIGGGIGASISAIRSGNRYMGWALLVFFVAMAVLTVQPMIVLGYRASY